MSISNACCRCINSFIPAIEFFMNPGCFSTVLGNIFRMPSGTYLFMTLLARIFVTVIVGPLCTSYASLVAPGMSQPTGFAYSHNRYVIFLITCQSESQSTAWKGCHTSRTRVPPRPPASAGSYSRVHRVNSADRAQIAELEHYIIFPAKRYLPVGATDRQGCRTLL